MPHTFPLLDRIADRAKYSPSSPAIIIPSADPTSPPTVYTYSHLHSDIFTFCQRLFSGTVQKPSISDDLKDTRVAILLSKSYAFVPILLGTFAAGGLALPLLPSLPLPEHAYMIENSGASIIICDRENQARAEELLKVMRNGSLLMVEGMGLGKRKEEHNEDVYKGMKTFAGDRKAMMLYTSGTVRSLPPSPSPSFEGGYQTENRPAESSYSLVS